MEHKPNLSSINFYAEKYASVICNNYFRTKEAINGKEILDVTPSRQINFLTVKIIFQSWLQETKKLKSPYFNYEAPEVQQSLGTLMNHLSKNIHIEIGEFKPLLRMGVAESLTLLLYPKEYFLELFNASSSGKRLQFESEIKPIFKYLKTHEPLVKLIEEAIEQEGKWIKKKEAIDLVADLIDKNKHLLDKPYEMIREINDIAPVGIYELAPHWDDKAVLDEKKSDQSPVSAMDFDILYSRKEAENERPAFTPKPTPPVETKQVTYGKIPEKEEKAVEKENTAPEAPATTRLTPRGRAEFAPRNDEFVNEANDKPTPPKPRPSIIDRDEEVERKQPDPIDRLIKTNTSVPYFKPAKDEEEEEKSEGTLLQKLAREASAINHIQPEKEAEPPKKTLLDNLKSTIQRKSLKDSVPLNMKMKFQKELFRDSEAEYNNAMTLIDQAADYHSALEMLKRKYWYEYAWDLENDATVQFLSMMDNHF